MTSVVLFKATESITNFHTTQQQYQTQIEEVQVVNTTHQNAIKNMTSVVLFKATDSITNFHTTQQQYQTQIEEVQGMKWRYTHFKDNKKFNDAGGNLKMVKNFNNAMREPVFFPY